MASTALALGAVAGTAAATTASVSARPAIAAGAPAAASAAQILRSGSGAASSLNRPAPNNWQAQLLSAHTSKTQHRRQTPRQIARKMLRNFRWSWRQFRYLNRLWERESHWNVHASNPYSGAYGIPQAVPGSKMASAGSHWRTSARTQIRWGLRYIRDVYGTPHRAWDHELWTGWY